MKLIALILLFTTQALATGHNFQKVWAPSAVMTAVADIYGELLTEERIEELGHGEIIKAVDVSLLAPKVFQTLAELFIVIDQGGALVNALDFVTFKHSIGMRYAQPIIVEHSLEAPKVFGVYKNGKLMGFTLGKPGTELSEADFPNGRRTLYLTKQGRVIRDGRGALRKMPQRNPHKTIKAEPVSPFIILEGLTCRGIL